MAYIGKAPGFGIRGRFYYTATATQTTFSGADDNGYTLKYADSKYLDVFLNGVLLVAGTDYTATTLTSITLTSGAAADDIIEIIAYDIFSIADTVSAANGGSFAGNIVFDGSVTFNGTVSGAGATGGGSDQVFYQNDQTVTTNYTIPADQNAMSAGPVSINSGVTVTVSTGARWVVV